MAELSKNQEPVENHVRFTSDADLLEIREEDTRPGKMSDSFRRWLEEKYGRKAAMPSDSAGEKTGT